jgi:hypothetical protein
LIIIFLDITSVQKEMQVLRQLGNDVYVKIEFKKYAGCTEAKELLNIVVLICLLARCTQYSPLSRKHIFQLNSV